MTGPIAQIVSLTCHANAVIHGQTPPQFFPTNSTCRFCEFIHFTGLRRTPTGEMEEVTFADQPEKWLAFLRDGRAIAARLLRTPENRPGFPDRTSAGFIGGGGRWTLELLFRSGQTDSWASRWDVGDRNALEQRVWRVKYGLVARGPTKEDQRRPLRTVKTDFRASLEEIKSFADSHSQSNFARCFADAIRALDDPDLDIGYDYHHRDLALPGQLFPEAASMLRAAQCAWVFGGMGSWNDISFAGDAQKEYETVSERLFSTLNEAIEVATSSSSTPSGNAVLEAPGSELPSFPNQ